MATVMEERLCWRTLANLQLRLIESQKKNAEFDQRISKLETKKGELYQLLEGLRLASRKETIDSLLEDREIVFLTRERDVRSTRQQSLTTDLKLVTNHLGKLKLDVDRRNNTIQKLEEQCTETKAATTSISVERGEALKQIESTRSRAEEQRLSIMGLLSGISKERDLGEKLKKRNQELKTVQAGLERRQRNQEKHIVKVQQAIHETRLKSREANKTLKEKLRDLRARSIEINRLSVQCSHLRTNIHAIPNSYKKRHKIAILDITETPKNTVVTKKKTSDIW